MSARRSSNPAGPCVRPFALDLPDTEATGDAVGAALADETEAQAYRWRLQLVIAEAAMMGGLVAVAGFMLGHPAIAILRTAVAVSGACLAAGLLLLSLSSSLGRAVRRNGGEIRP